jgi:hypothetical protein
MIDLKTNENSKKNSILRVLGDVILQWSLKSTVLSFNLTLFSQ